MTLYFAYGSNIDRAAMAQRCPASQPLGPACLLGHRFILMPSGFASVVPDAACTVHGVLWDLARRDEAALDAYEEVAEGLFVKVKLVVRTAEGARPALVYIGTGAGAGIAPPAYLAAVVAAARAWGLPEEYVQALEWGGATVGSNANPAEQDNPDKHLDQVTWSPWKLHVPPHCPSLPAHSSSISLQAISTGFSCARVTLS